MPYLTVLTLGLKRAPLVACRVAFGPISELSLKKLSKLSGRLLFKKSCTNKQFLRVRLSSNFKIFN